MSYLGDIFHKLKSRFIQKSSPSSFYEILGQKEGIRLLVESFYEKMENDSLAKDCLHAHPLENGKISEEIKNKLFMFLSGWMGGPNLFVEKLGPPRMRARHSHIKISEKERDQWLYCMEYALNHSPRSLKNSDYTKIMNSFMALAYRIQNQQSSKST